jgi:hypothetical protein
MKMIDLHNEEHNQGKHGFTMEMNAFGDMVSVMCIACLPCFLFSVLYK